MSEYTHTTFTYASGVTVQYTGTQINKSSFSGYPISVVIGDLVTCIAADSFAELALSSVTIGHDSLLQTIGDRAFFGTKITTITIPNSVTMIGNSAFAKCTLLATVNVLPGSNLRCVANHTFEETNIRTIDLPSSLTSIGNYAFYRTNLNFSVNEHFIPSSVTYIGSYAFAETEITGVKLPSSVTHIDTYAFANNTELTAVNTIGSKLQYLSDSAFEGTEIRSFAIPNSLLSIGKSVFKNVEQLRTVTIDPMRSVLRIIDDWAFGNTRISAINIPKSLMSIGDYAFYNTNLQSVELNTCNLKTIGDCAFSKTCIREVVIPSSVVSIGGSAFSSLYDNPNPYVFTNEEDEEVSIARGEDNNTTHMISITFTTGTSTMNVGSSAIQDDLALTAVLAIYNFIKFQG
jgi:hypothetical protein